ncbi:MAG: hypothetical protein WD207_06230 [Xanthobacteraceae bacterium]
MSASQHPSIQGLIELAQRDGVDIRPTLVRVLADLYVQESGHSPAERSRFAELVCRLLCSVDLATRAAVAEKLAPYPATPPAVAARLARDEITVADPILRLSPVLGEAELHSILDTTGIAHAIAITARPGLPESIAKRLRQNVAPRRTADESLRASSIVVPQREPALTTALARRYLVTGSHERRLILTALRACPPVEHEERLSRIDRGFGQRLERAALRHRPQEFSLLLQQSAGLPPELAARAAADPSGDPIVAICRALEIPFNITSRILLFLNPEIGASVQQVFALSEGFEQIVPMAARRLVGAWCGMMPAAKPNCVGIERRMQDRHPTRKTRSAARPILRGMTPARPAAASES